MPTKENYKHRMEPAWEAAFLCSDNRMWVVVLVELICQLDTEKDPSWENVFIRQGHRQVCGTSIV